MSHKITQANSAMIAAAQSFAGKCNADGCTWFLYMTVFPEDYPDILMMIAAFYKPSFFLLSL